MAAGTEHQRSYTLTHAYTMSHKSSHLLVAVWRAKAGELSPCFSSLICVEKWHIIYSLQAVWKCWQSEWRSWTMESYHLSYLHYEYGYYQCLASPGLILWFSSAEKLSGMVGFLTRQLVRTKTCLIFTRMEMFDSWSWTKRIYSGLMFHWAREKPQTLSPSYSVLCEYSPRDFVWG